MTTSRAPRGFTLIELMVALSIAALLLVLAAPSYVRWLAETEVQNGASTLLNGLQVAQAEAIRRNVNVQFVLDPNTATGGWSAQIASDGTAIPNAYGEFRGAAERMIFTTTPASQTTVTFTPLGQIQEDLDNPQTARIQRITVTSSSTAQSRQVVVGLDETGTRRSSAKMQICDPNFTTFSGPDPKVCP
jgi:type IV fimbrial biogenesis protein FimT